MLWTPENTIGQYRETVGILKNTVIYIFGHTAQHYILLSHTYSFIFHVKENMCLYISEKIYECKRRICVCKRRIYGCEIRICVWEENIGVFERKYSGKESSFVAKCCDWLFGWDWVSLSENHFCEGTPFFLWCVMASPALCRSWELITETSLLLAE